jgi:hypothetical protein
LFCEEPSEDRLTQRVAGAEVTFGYAAGRLRPYAGFALSYVNLSFDVNSRYSGVIDRSHRHTDGAMVALSGGVSLIPSDRWMLGVVLFYAPLSVVRPPGTESEKARTTPCSTPASSPHSASDRGAVSASGAGLGARPPASVPAELRHAAHGGAPRRPASCRPASCRPAS